MPNRVRTKKAIQATTLVVVALLLGALGFVWYFMHTVYEADAVLEPSDVPAAVAESFHSRFQGASDIQWKLEDDLYEAEFTWQGHEETEAYFGLDGSWRKTELAIAFNDLPHKAQEYLLAQKRAKPTDIERIETHDGGVGYEAELRGWLTEWDCIFDAEGHLLERERDGSTLEEEPGEEDEE